MGHARTLGEAARHAIPTLSCVLTHLTNPVHTQHRTDRESADGSKITGKQVAIAPGSAGNIPTCSSRPNPRWGRRHERRDV